MGAWRKAGVWLGLVEDDDARDYDDEFEDDDFAVPTRTRPMVRPQRGVEHDRLERDRLERGRRDRSRDLRAHDYDEPPRGRDERGGFGSARGRGDPYAAERGRIDREPPAVRPEMDDSPRTVRELRTERVADPTASRFGERVADDEPRSASPGPRSAGGTRSTSGTVRPLVRPTAGSTALSVPAEEDLTLAPQVHLRERAAVPDERAARRYEITTVHPTSYSDARAIGEQFRDGHPVIMNLTEMDEPDAKRLVDFAAGLAFGLRGSMERVTNRVFLLTPPNIRVSDEEKRRIADTQL
jgi:cell division inhibitor SepF